MHAALLLMRAPEELKKKAVRKWKGLDIDLRRVPGIETLADKALIAILKVIVEVNRDPQISAYKNDRRLKDGLGDGTDFKVRLGFGLHAGWGKYRESNPLCIYRSTTPVPG